jgi:hypothetical protein
MPLGSDPNATVGEQKIIELVKIAKNRSSGRTKADVLTRNPDPLVSSLGRQYSIGDKLLTVKH